MMALGKLSAGLAHELNNPAAAIVRSSTLLKQHLLQQPETFKKAISVQMDAKQVDALTERMFEVMSRSRQTALTLMQRSDKEDELTDWLDDHEVENAMEIAEHFVEFGFEPDDLEFIGEHVKMPHLSPVLNWVNNNLVTEKMVTDIQEASQRISDLVGSVKNFTHMDRAQDKQFSDIRIGLRNTLTMLNHKIKKGNVTVVEHFDETLPEVKAFIGELNQVWTNIVDNALDAMEGTPDSTLEIKTERDKEFVKITIIDNGPGIPKDDIDKIFDPFFTTKEIGKGTGLGLDIVARIVKQHHGSIKVKSVPGKTEFELWLDAWERKKMQHRDPAVEQYFVIEVMNEVVGCGGYTKVNNDEITLTWGMISQSMHGKGIGKTLLQYRLGIVKSLFPNASVILDTTQLSYVFFERLGFKITGIIKDFYGQGLDRYDMKLTF
jgi:signal transduction histidine kinase/predicted GNAT family N-acyltransferase